MSAGPSSPVAVARRLVVKIGSSLVTNDGRGLDADAIARWAGEIAALQREGRQMVLVSSGAIAAGMQRLNWSRRPQAIHELQAAAAVGQMGLVQAWESAFAAHGLRTAQVLLTHDDLSDRRRYLNARSTLRTLLALSVVPIINENDTVTTDEIRLGDNDTLGALVTNLIEADVLVLLTDQPGLYSADPRKHPAAIFIDGAQAGDPALEAMAGGAGSAIGRGGMLTKILAAKRAARSGAHTVIASGREVDVLTRLAAGESRGAGGGGANPPHNQTPPKKNHPTKNAARRRRVDRHAAACRHAHARCAQAMARRPRADGRPRDARRRRRARADA